MKGINRRTVEVSRVNDHLLRKTGGIARIGIFLATDAPPSCLARLSLNLRPWFFNARSIFYNDLFAFDMERRRWYHLALKKSSKQKGKGKKENRKLGGGGGGGGGAGPTAQVARCLTCGASSLSKHKRHFGVRRSRPPVFLHCVLRTCFTALSCVVVRNGFDVYDRLSPAAHPQL